MAKAKKSVLVRAIGCIVVLSMFLSFFLFNKEIGVTVSAADGISGQPLGVDKYYYIKNVHTGKYLDVYNASTSDGTSIIQYNFTGNANQKWKLKKMTYGYYNGYYYFVSALSDARVFAMTGSTSSTSSLLKLKTINYSSSVQFFSLSALSDCSYYICSNTSGNNASLNVLDETFSSGASINQSYSHDSNCAWLIEPVDYTYSFGVNYAYNHWDVDSNNHISTYPLLGEDCANFVSQCLVAAGKHYSGDWYIRKKNDTYPNPVVTTNNTYQLNYSWELANPSPWISAIQFGNYWKNNVPYTDCSLISYGNGNFSNSFGRGDVVQLMKKDSFGIYYGYHTMYITQIYEEGNVKHKFTAHTSSYKDKSLVIVCGQYSNSDYKFRFYDFT